MAHVVTCSRLIVFSLSLLPLAVRRERVRVVVVLFAVEGGESCGFCFLAFGNTQILDP